MYQETKKVGKIQMTKNNRPNGIDVAKWNVVKDYKKLKENGIDFAIVKVINKSNEADGGFNRHLEGFASADIPIIAGYNYSYATTEIMAITAANAWLKVAKGLIPMCFLDIEDKIQKALPKQTLVKIIKAYQKVIEAAGVKFGIYCNLDWYKNVIDTSSLDCPFWIAKYGKNTGTYNESDKPSIHHVMYGWQYSSKCQMEGIEGDVDINEWYVDIEADDTIKNSGIKVAELAYSQTQFIKDMAVALKLQQSATGKEVLEKTVTISTNCNRTHACVTPLERFMKLGGFYTGTIEADAGKTPIFGNGMAKATIMFQTYKVHLNNPDAVWTRKANSYQIALNVL